MRKTLLSGVSLLGILAANAQTLQQTVSLSTGVFDTYNTTLGTWDIPVTNPDDTWKVRLPLSINPSGAFSPAFVTTGRVPGMSPTSPWDHYHHIARGVYVLAPRVHLNPPSYSDAVYGDINTNEGAPEEYLYRMTFNFDKTCNTNVSSVSIDANLLTGDGITGIYLNGHPLPLPVYPQIYPPSNYPSTDYLNIEDAWNAPKFSNGLMPYPGCGASSPFPPTSNGTCINPVSIPVNPGFLANGNNVIVITMNPALGAPTFNSVNGPSASSRNSKALMIDAKLEIFYTQGANIFNVWGNNLIASNQSTTINVSINNGPPSNYLLHIPALGYSGQPNGIITVTAAPPVSTTYTIYLTNLTTGCVDKVRWPITVLNTSTGWVSVDPNNSTEMVCPGTTGVINTVLNDAAPDGYTTRIAKDYFSTPFYEGSPNAEVAVNPEETTEYIIRTTDPNGVEQITSFVVELLPAEICHDNFRAQQGSGIKDAGFSVSPNPGNGLLQLTVTNTNPKTIQVYDALGKLVFEKKNTTEKSTAIDITSQPKGVYLVKVTDGTTVSAERIIKQ